MTATYLRHSRTHFVAPADAGAHPVIDAQMDARVPAFAGMTAGMTVV